MDRTASIRHLTILSAVIWIFGGGVLAIKGAGLLQDAAALAPDRPWPWLAVAAGLVVGGAKARFLFHRFCKKNLTRIAALPRPRLWQCFRPGFFAFLTLMILAGATLSRLAHGDYPLLIAVAALDLTIAVALLGSSPAFWTHRSSQPVN